MNNHPEAINNILNNHSVSSLFDVNVIDYSAGKIVLGLNARAPLFNGALGCIVDCVARIAGQASVGDCFVSEYELNSFRQSTVSEFVASARIESSSSDNATYCCEIYAVENSAYKPLAESQGTLVKN
ncbi:hypothetical protein GCM10011613_00570 [Cellvibrio zantedeschiae]|uniref:Uncharacterized protein n=1 Tax=Cellvibrio zantedeschiae TaxID=1237077 RepID=A0ABQ3AQV8_9GAMM|nr:hypothetical protein [Cellvibrio zantedeschiae]GGY61096.1 hypothetical protein GCM10011613_00570 [Cellvibrio zantedeschiae]